MKLYTNIFKVFIFAVVLSTTYPSDGFSLPKSLQEHSSPHTNPLPTLRKTNAIVMMVNTDDVARLWTALTKDFNDSWTTHGKVYQVNQVSGHFTDLYWDTSDHSLLKNGGSLRYRHVPNDADLGRLSRLLQLKVPLQSEVPGQTYSEATFTVHPFDRSTVDIDDPFQIIENTQRGSLTKALLDLKIAPASLSHFLDLNQERRRLIFQNNNQQILKISLDTVTSKRLWYSATFSQIRLALNEELFASSPSTKQSEFLNLQDAVKEKIASHGIPLHQDRSSKIMKMYLMLSSKGIPARASINYGYLARGPFFPLVILAIAAIIIFAYSKTQDPKRSQL